MKIYITSLLLLISALSNAQTMCWDLPNTITTDPTKPNTVNTWDWRVEKDTMYMRAFFNNTNTCLPQLVTMPMFKNPSISNNNLSSHQKILTPSLKDHQPHDGWELLAKNFGRSGGWNNAVAVPFYALYNRYLGKIRVFFMFKNPLANLVNGARLNLSFRQSARYTALLQHLTPIAQTVINFDNSNAFSVPNYIDNANEGYWFSADYQVAYDPCTCYDLQSSKIPEINFTIEASQLYTLDATINGSIISSQIANTGVVSEPGASDKNVATSAELNQSVIDKGIKKGTEYYNTWDGYRGTANNVLKSVDDYFTNDLNKKLKEAYPYGTMLSTSSGLITYTNPPTVADLRTSDVGHAMLLGYDYNAQYYNAAKSLISALPYVGLAFGVFDFLSNVNKSQNQIQQAPTVSQTNLKLTLTGEFKGVFPLINTIYNTPGFTTDPNIGDRPIYNNILGVVNVMEIPNFEYNELKPKINNFQLICPDEDFYNYLDGEMPKIHQYRFSDDIKYVLNPATNMSVLSVEAAIVLEFDKNLSFFNTPMRTMYNNQLPVEFGFFTMLREQIAAIIPKQPALTRLEKAGWQLEYLSKGYPNFLDNPNYPINDGICRLRTPYVPLQCVKNLVFNLFNSNEYSGKFILKSYKRESNFFENWRTFKYLEIKNRAPKIYLKLIFTLKRNDQNVTESFYTQVQTFNISEQLANASKVSKGYYLAEYYSKNYDPTYSYLHELSDGTIENYPRAFPKGFIPGQPHWNSFINAPENLVLENQVLTGDVYAQNEIIIKGGVTHQGAEVNLIAGNKISTQSGGHKILNTNNGQAAHIIYTVGKTKTCTNPTPPQAASWQIANVCNSGKYKANAGLNRMAAPNDSITKNNQPSRLTAALSPNPNDGTFKLTVNKTGKVSYVVYDVFGRLVYEGSYENTAEVMNYKITCDNCLTSGIYLVKVSHNNEVINHKVIITK